MATSSKRLIYLLGMLVAFGPLSIDMYLPSLPTIAHDLHASASQVQLSITIFFIGFSLGMLVYGPLSDSLGRKPLLLVGISIYVMASLGCVFAFNIESLVFFRLLQAIGGASASVISRALVRDLFPPQETPKILSFMHIVTMIATLIAPIFGSIIMQLYHWQAIFVFLSLFSCLILYAVYRQIEHKKPVGVAHNLLANYWQVMKVKASWGYMLCLGGTFAGMFAYITGSSFIFIQQFHFSATQYALVFASNIFTIIVFSYLNTRLLKRYSPQQLLQAFASLACAAGLFLLSLSLTAHDQALWIMLGQCLFVGMTGAIGANSIASLLHLFPNLAGTASALAVSLQFGLGAVASYLVTLFYVANSTLAMTGVMAACGTVACCSIFLFQDKT